MSSSQSIQLIKQKYRTLARLIKLLPESSYCPEQTMDELRSSFRKPFETEETIEKRIKSADERISFLKMITPKTATIRQQESSSTSTGSGGGRWIYKNGQRLENVDGTLRDQNGRVVSNWDGKNLDPENVKRHNNHLKRLGFRNNQHAKGIF